MHRKSYTRRERKEQVLNTLLIRVQHGQPPKMTSSQLAKSLDITASSHFNKILQEMVKDGFLEVDTKPHRPNITKSIYRLPEGSYTYPTRKIILNSFNRQLELDI